MGYYYDIEINGFLHSDIHNISQDAIQLTDERYQQLFDAVSNGAQIIVDNGELKLIPPQPSPYHTLQDGQWVLDEEAKKAKCDAFRATLIDLIDTTAAGISAHWTRFTTEYEQREAAALVYKGHNFEGDPGVYVTSFSSAAGLDNKTAAELILQQAEGLRTLQQHLATQRMRKYELLKPELTEEQLQSVHDDIVYQMTILAEAYK